MPKLNVIKFLDGSVRCYAIVELLDTCDGYRTRIANGRYDSEERARSEIEHRMTDHLITKHGEAE